MTRERAAVISTLAENMPEDRARTLLDAGIAPMMGLEETLAAAEASADVHAAWQRGGAEPVLLAPAPAEDSAQLLDEAAAKAMLAEHGLASPARRQAADGAVAARAAEALGFPVALKGQGVAHKTEAGAVRLGLASAAEVKEAAASMTAARGFLVERMVQEPVAELIVGVVRDPVYGFTLTVGAGGILTELLADSATLLVPSRAEDVRAALRGLRIWPLLEGYRGKSAADTEAVVAAVMAVQRFVRAEAARLEELDVNPLMVTPDGALAADALIRIRA